MPNPDSFRSMHMMPVRAAAISLPISLSGVWEPEPNSRQRDHAFAAASSTGLRSTCSSTKEPDNPCLRIVGSLAFQSEECLFIINSLGGLRILSFAGVLLIISTKYHNLIF